MLVNLIKLFFLFVTVTSVTVAQDDLIVELPEGKIQGHIRKSFAGNDYYGFQEIPYAAPPVGQYRFKEARSPEPWDGVRDATKNTIQCIQDPQQNYPIDKTLEESEDCLFLNVFSPEKPGSNSSLPVYLFIHGGGFVIGSSSPAQYNPGRYVDYGVMVVTINHRLGALGFATTGDDVIPGNLGFKDQVFAMKWVQSNIHLFGGDPTKVTIGGQSAGSFAVSVHLIAQNVSGLFRAGVMESGGILGPLTFASNPRAYAFELGKALDENFNSEKSEDLLELLLKASPKDIITASDKVIDQVYSHPVNVTRLIWVAVIESENAKNPLITSPMHEAFMTGKFNRVPVLLGFGTEEFLTLQNNVVVATPEVYDEDPSKLVFPDYHVSAENSTIMGNKLRRIYTDTSFTENNASFIKYLSDSFFTNSMIRQAELSSEYVPIYLYQFSYMGDLGLILNPNRHAYPGAEGAGHCEEMIYIWDIVKPTIEGDILAMERLLLMWTNFIKYSNPTPKEDPLLDNVIWTPVKSDNIQFLNINYTLEVKSDPRYYSQVKSLLLEYLQPPFLVF